MVGGYRTRSRRSRTEGTVVQFLRLLDSDPNGPHVSRVSPIRVRTETSTRPTVTGRGGPPESRPRRKVQEGRER